jgi:hypothetical protein
MWVQVWLHGGLLTLLAPRDCCFANCEAISVGSPHEAKRNGRRSHINGNFMDIGYIRSSIQVALLGHITPNLTRLSKTRVSYDRGEKCFNAALQPTEASLPIFSQPRREAFGQLFIVQQNRFLKIIKIAR